MPKPPKDTRRTKGRAQRLQPPAEKQETHTNMKNQSLKDLYRSTQQTQETKP
jgi:hypothetical protein